ncbi:MAG TPA: NADH-ubiquinone oxidoreductase-F iron-sulfur binding region domain-containing protein [Candidatus Polarisedimenticolia bacterium]|nr:NADH-ubiquinone oxidoreductase-F iron-sulfur binding region domain-containing protein [Candidatus Polarisedimenticolia bacterium]
MATLLKTPRSWPAILLRPGTDDPTDLDAAIRAGAFAGLRAAIEQGPDGTIETIAVAGLRGRGGSGYPTADKWRTARAAVARDGARPLVVANGYGADAASRTDLELLERNPIAVIEGLAIAAISVGADEAIVAVRAEATEAVARLTAVIGAAEEANLLGEDVAGSGLDVFVSVRTVQGAYMLGEETVLLKALAGKRGQPEQRPPHPAEKGFDGRPTVVQNVQTLAAVPWILVNGAAAFAGIGPRDCPGTILVSVRGPGGAGVAEVPFGTTLGDIVALAGAPKGPAKGGTIKAVLVGGPSGGILPAAALDTKYTFGDLRAAGAHVGSGSVVAADERACVVDLARVLTRYCADEACGKTIPCRIGTTRLAEINERMAAGTSRAGDVQLATDLATDIVGSGLCDHERLATLPLMSGLRYFREELDAHVERGVCPAGVCRPIALAAGAAH